MEEIPKIKTVEDWKSIYLQRFKDLHDNFSNEIPEEMLNGLNPENHKYKVRGNWFASVKNNFSNAERMNMFPEDFNKEWHEFFAAYSKRMLGSTYKVRTTKEEIDVANNLLKRAQELLINK